MVEVSIRNGTVCLEVKGLDKLWAFRSKLEIPLAHVRAARADASIARGAWNGYRALGTSVPGVIRAGTFHQEGKRIFCDVHDPEKTVVLELQHDEYDQLVVEVADPAATVTELSEALARFRG